MKFSYFVPMFNLWPPGWGLFWPQGHFMNKLGRDPLEMLHTKYQSSTPSSFRDEKFWKQASLFICFKLVIPWTGPVLTPGASYEQIWYRSTRRCYIPNIKALHLLVSEKKIFKLFLLWSYVSNLRPPGRCQFWPQGHHMNNLGRDLLGDATYQISKLYTF